MPWTLSEGIVLEGQHKCFFFKLRFTPCKAEQPLRHMDLPKKKNHKKIKAYRKSVQKEPTFKMCLLILDLKPFRS